VAITLNAFIINNRGEFRKKPSQQFYCYHLEVFNLVGLRKSRRMRWEGQQYDFGEW